MAKNIHSLIEDQVNFWQKTKSQHGKPETKASYWPVISISREYGTQGAALAHEIGARTGFAVWDKELLQAIAEESGGDEAILRSLDEHRRNGIDDAVRAAVLGGRHTNTQYQMALMRVIHTLGAHGKCVIVGRGANYVLDPKTVLRVRVVCPEEERVRIYARQHKLDLKKARKEVQGKESDRSHFVFSVFKKDLSRPSDYDLVVNTGTFTLSQAADLILLAYEKKIGRAVLLERK